MKYSVLYDMNTGEYLIVFTDCSQHDTVVDTKNSKKSADREVQRLNATISENLLYLTGYD